MKVKEIRIGPNAKHLPLFAGVVLRQHLASFCSNQIALSRQFEVPLLKYIAHLTEEEIMDITKVAVIEFLTCLEENKSFEFINLSLKRWLADQLEIVGKFEIEPADITLINYVRAKSLKKLISSYTSDPEVMFDLADEIDLFFLNFTTAGMDTYVNILKDRLQKETDFNAKLTDALPGMVFIYNIKEHREVYANRKGQNILGFTNGEVMEDASPTFFRNLIDPKDIATIDAFYAALAEVPDGMVKNYEYRIRNVGNQYRNVRDYVLVYSRDENGKPLEVIGITFDVTDEKLLTEKLAKREQQLLEAQAIAHIGSYEWNLTDDTSSNTPEVYNIFGFDQTARLNDFLEFVHPEDVEKVKSSLQESFTSGSFECEYRFRTPDKEKVIWSKGHVHIENGVAKTMLGTIQDITERKRIETDLLKKSLELEQSNESLQHFASVASHDLKEPLRKISLLSEKVFLREKDKLSERSAEDFIRIREAAARMQAMIDDILAYSSLNRHEEKVMYPLEKILEEVEEIFEYAIVEKQVSIESETLPDAFIIPSQMRQLFQNLIANSIKFAQPGIPPKIEITYNIKQNNQPIIEIVVKDNGIGFPEEEAANVFVLFNRLNDRTAYSGNGIGLAVCKKIVENHNGTIKADSSPGNGATFTIQIPQ